VWKYLNQIEKMGGAVKAIESGYFQAEIGKSAYEYQRAIEERRKIVVGVNDFEVQEKGEGNLFQIDPSVREDQVERLKKLRASRNNDAVRVTLDRLRHEALGGDNLMTFIMDAVESYATVGEISDALRAAWGSY